MKIAVPALKTEVVGFRYDQPPRFYYTCPKRPNILPEPSYADLTETKLTTRVVFDRDLRIAQRAAGVGRLASLSAFLSVAFPLAAVYVSGVLIGRGLQAIIDFGKDRLSDIGVDTSWGIRREFARLGRMVTK